MIICATGALAMQFYGLPASAQALEPYQATASIGNSATCPNRQCILEFSPVPAGKRLVLTSVSAQLGPAANVVVLEGNDNISYFVPVSDPNLGYLAVPVTFYYDAMTKPTARIFAPNPTQTTSLIVTIVGHLLALEQPK
jgi:predicted Ser/Thr protein kinase